MVPNRDVYDVVDVSVRPSVVLYSLEKRKAAEKVVNRMNTLGKKRVYNEHINWLEGIKIG